MSIPALKRLRAQFPHSRIDVLCRPHLADLFGLVAPIDQIITVVMPAGKEKILATAAKIRALPIRYDLGILFTNSLATALEFRLASLRQRLGYARDGRSCLLTRAVPVPDSVHYTDYYDMLVSCLCGEGSKSVSIGPLLTIPTSIENDLRQHAQAMGVPLEPAPIIIAPGAAFGSAKQWLLPRFAALINTLRARYPDRMVICLGGKAEYTQIEAILKDTGRDGVINLAGSLPLALSLAILSKAACVLANDSGLMHAAWALQVPLVAIFGPTDPKITRPLSPLSRIVYKRADCSPCKHRHCPIDHRCMTAIEVDEVAKAMFALLDKG